MFMISIGLKGLAKFMTAAPAAQRKILIDHKFPKYEGEAQAQYYREARRFIRAYHQKGNPEGQLSLNADEVRTLAQVHGGMSGIRLRHNSRALREYEQCWGRKQFEVLSPISLALQFHGVRISVFPDLHVMEDGVEKIVKFEFSRDEPDAHLIKIMSQTMFEAALEGGLVLSAAGVLVLDVHRKKAHKGARVGSKIKRDIEAACQTIAAVWPGLEPATSRRQQAS